MSESKDGKIIQNISNTTGSVIAPIVTGENNKVEIRDIKTSITKNVLTISESQLERVQTDYAISLKEFLEKFNVTLKENNIEQQKVAELQNELNGFVEELKDATPTSGITKKTDIKSRFIKFISKAIKYLPKLAPIITYFTPLAPLGGIIGEAVDQIVIALQKENQ